MKVCKQGSLLDQGDEDQECDGQQTKDEIRSRVPGPQNGLPLIVWWRVVNDTSNVELRHGYAVSAFL
jgi:hypothetical protein